MDEDKLDAYYRQVFGLHEYDHDNERIEQLRDENGFRVDGCYRVTPIPE